MGHAARHSGPPSRRPEFELEAPSMISTDQSVSFDLALSEQGALMRTAPLEGSEPGPGPNHHDVYPVRRDGERTGAFELIQIGYADKRPDLHGMAFNCTLSLQVVGGGWRARRERPAEWGIAERTFGDASTNHVFPKEKAKKKSDASVSGEIFARRRRSAMRSKERIIAGAARNSPRVRNGSRLLVHIIEHLLDGLGRRAKQSRVRGAEVHDQIHGRRNRHGAHGHGHKGHEIVLRQQAESAK